MALNLDRLPIFQAAEQLSDEVWAEVARWERFNREVVGSQLIRAVDSIGANIAESHGRFHYAEKINFLYYSRGSLSESVFWLGRCAHRSLIPAEKAQQFLNDLDQLAQDTNSYINYLRNQQRKPK
jgi:four helix bundle protein